MPRTPPLEVKSPAESTQKTTVLRSRRSQIPQKWQFFCIWQPVQRQLELHFPLQFPWSSPPSSGPKPQKWYLTGLYPPTGAQNTPFGGQITSRIDPEDHSSEIPEIPNTPKNGIYWCPEAVRAPFPPTISIVEPSEFRPKNLNMVFSGFVPPYRCPEHPIWGSNHQPNRPRRSQF